MKGSLLFLLVVTGGAIMALPGFRLLWDLETSSARIGLVHADGVTQWSESGPMAFWPRWASAPIGAGLKVVVHYEAAAGHGESGLGELTLGTSAPAAQAAYARQLEQAGWSVQVSQFEAPLPELAPHTARFCLVQALRDGHRLMFRAVEGESGQDNLVWDHAAEFRPVIGSTPGLCQDQR
jgi:hypothetical protein